MSYTYTNDIMFQSFNGYFYTCHGFGHKANQCKCRMNGKSNSQRNSVCHNCNKPRHIARFCKNIRKNNLENRNNPVTKIDLTKVEKEMEKIWRNKEETKNKKESETSNEYIPPSSADNSLKN